MGNLGQKAEPTQNENLEQKKTKDGEPVTKKPGSKAQGRKRTKTGCLSKFSPLAHRQKTIC
jgi:hypothetical protein